MRIAIVLALAMALGRSLSTDIPAASIFDQTNDTLVEYVYNGDRYKHVFPDVNFEFSSEVYERNEPLANGIADDFDADNDRPSRLYKPSKNCWLERTQLTFDRSSQTPIFKKGIDAYLFDSTETVYILTENTIITFSTQWNGETITLNQMFRTELNDSLKFNSSQAVFANLKTKIYLTDGNKMLFLSMVRGDDFKVTGLKVTPTNLNFNLSENGSFIKLIAIDSNTFISLTTNSVSKYKIKGELTIQQDSNSLPKTLRDSSNSFTDGISDDRKLYILEQRKIIVLDVKDMSQYTVHELNLGVCTRIEKVTNTLEVICEYHKNVFVAEVLIKDNIYYVNRFYDQVNKIQDIDFYNGKGFYIGQHQMLIISHSINRNNLLDANKQHMKSYASFGIHSFDVMIRYSDRTQAILIGVSSQRVMILKVVQIPASLNCDFSDAGITTKTMVVEFNTSFCGFDYWDQWRKNHTKEQDIFCRQRIPFNFNVALALPEKSQNVITMTAVMVVLAIMVLLVAFASRWATRMQVLMRQMSLELQNRQSPDTNKGVLSSHIAMLPATVG